MKKISLLLMYLILTNCCSPEFSECNGLLSSCSGSPNGEYCLFGYKWGEEPQFSPSGINEDGPQLPGGEITYSFHTEIKLVSTHQKDDMTTISFDDKGDCARAMAENALEEWEKYGNFNFVKLEDNARSNIQFIAAKEVNNNTGNTNYKDELCSEISGRIVLTDTPIERCQVFYILCLHEIGHVLGLGHVSSQNIMKQGRDKYFFEGLREGDINGIRAIYGEK